MYLNAELIKDVLYFGDTHNTGKAAQVGWDLTIKEVKLIGGGNHIITKSNSNVDKNAYVKMPLMINPDNPKQHMFVLQPGVYSITFHQGCVLPNNIMAQIVQRSSLLRCGVDIKSAIYDPGFKTDLMGAVMIVHNTIQIEEGARVAQIIMSQTVTAEVYDGQYQAEKDVK